MFHADVQMLCWNFYQPWNNDLLRYSAQVVVLQIELTDSLSICPLSMEFGNCITSHYFQLVIWCLTACSVTSVFVIMVRYAVEFSPSYRAPWTNFPALVISDISVMHCQVFNMNPRYWGGRVTAIYVVSRIPSMQGRGSLFRSIAIDFWHLPFSFLYVWL